MTTTRTLPRYIEAADLAELRAAMDAKADADREYAYVLARVTRDYRLTPGTTVNPETGEITPPKA